MKPNEFTNEGLATNLIGHLANHLANKYNIPDRAQQQRFANSFATQVQQQLQAHPNISIDDFLKMYWPKNNWDPSHLPAGYQTSLKNAIGSLPPNPTLNDFKKLGSVVFNIAKIMPTTRPGHQLNVGQSNAQQAQLDPSTNQIIAKIRSMKNTPDEIDDLEYIVNIALIKLNKVDPQNYPKIAKLLFNNGGNPATTMARMQQTQQAPTPQAVATQNNPVNYSGGQSQGKITSFNNNIKPTNNNTTVANTQANTQVQTPPATDATQATHPTTNNVRPAGDSKDVPAIGKVEPKLNPSKPLPPGSNNSPNLGDFSDTVTGSDGPEFNDITRNTKAKNIKGINDRFKARKEGGIDRARAEMERNSQQHSGNDAGLPQ
jgi:hypothetical protein